MNIRSILATVDHTLLSTTATWEDIKAICDDGIQYQTASICIPPCYVKAATQYVEGKIPVCTVIGFPNGYSSTAVKIYETADAIQNGADEIDMVIPVGKLKNREYDEILQEIKK